MRGRFVLCWRDVFGVVDHLWNWRAGFGALAGKWDRGTGGTAQGRGLSGVVPTGGTERTGYHPILWSVPPCACSDPWSTLSPTGTPRGEGSLLIRHLAGDPCACWHTYRGATRPISHYVTVWMTLKPSNCGPLR